MCEAELRYDSGELLMHAVLFFYGSKATNELSRQIALDIETHWNEPGGIVKIKSRDWLVRFQIEGIWARSLSPAMIHGNRNPRNNYFRLEEFSPHEISFVDGVGSNTGYFKLDNLINESSTAAHEFGHTLGLDHPEDLDFRGKGAPGIMYPRGTLVDPQFQWNPDAMAGDSSNGGTMNPYTRKVLKMDIESLRLKEYNFVNNHAVIGAFTNVWHQAFNL